jgi:hypothetical protein
VEVAEQLLAVARSGDGRRHRRREVLRHGELVGEDGVVIPAEGQPARRRLFVGHRHGAVESRPGVAVARIERVVHLADEVREPAPVELRRVGAAEHVERPPLRLGDERIDRVGRRGEVVRRVPAHLVQVHDDLRIPLQQRPGAPLRFGLRHREVVAVHVEEVVVRPPARPGLVMLRRLRIGIRFGRAAQQVASDEPVAAVGVLHRVDDDESLPQRQVHVGVAARRQEVIRLGQRGVGRGDLVAVDAVDEPHDHRQRRDQLRGVGAAGGERLHPAPHLVQRPDAVG